MGRRASISSTKRNRKKSKGKAQETWGASSSEKRQAATSEKRRTPDAPPPSEAAYEIPERAWLVASIVILMVATALRVNALDLKPMHHDEGVNGFFLTNLLQQGAYRYDPNNYHGPTLYYLSIPAVALFGLTTFAVRFVTALFGVGVVWLVLALRRRVGSVGALTAAALVAVSPGCVYYSRYFIHEIPFVFFTLGLVVAALRFYETGATHYLLLASASAAMLFATKETAFISVGTLALAGCVAWLWVKWRGDGRGKRRDGGGGFAESGLSKFGASAQAQAVVAGAVVLFVAIWVIFYSSFFTNWQGVVDSFKAFAVWKQTGMSEFHGKPLGTYVNWLWQEEAPILILAAVGSCVALFERRKNRFAIFAGAWGFGLLAAYTLISYKTPWLMLSFVVPLAIAGGYAVQALGRLGPFGAKGLAPALAVAAVALAVCTYQTRVLNFREYDNDAYIYVYSHTRRDAHRMLSEIERLAEATGRGKDTGMTVASPEYWPLPWYLREYKGVGYVGSIAASYDPATTPIVVGRESADAKENQVDKLRVALGAGYRQVGVYDLRPGVRLALFARSDLVR
ncbi:MAG TPA: flippase activity-associated protein Agl23 [Pyrinomonadaceae bacterium]|nr:flippase activity-associated protein Agl23 [Pyrinomonadaceae bacterium]